MINMKNNLTPLWGYNIYCSTFEEFVELLDKRLINKKVTSLLAMNTLKLHLGEEDPIMKKKFQDFDFITCDGQSMVWALRILNGIKTNHLSGVELMIKLIDLANKKGYSIFFLGSPQSLLDKVKVKIEENYPKIEKIGFQNGFYDIDFEEKEIVSKISNFKPDLLFVAFGSPRKEEFIHKYKKTLNATILMGVGGSYEVFVGEKKLDPLTKKLGLRWFIRMIQDPKRLFSRYLNVNSFFLKKLIMELIKKLNNR